MKRKLLAFVLAVCMVLGMIPVVSAATSGTCGPNLRWSYDSATATMTITGTGEMTEFLTDTSKPIPWKGLEFETRNLIVEHGVTTLGTYAFQNFGELVSVKLPDSLVKIGERTFEGCYALREIDLPDGIKTIGNYAFENSGLTSVRIPESVTTLNSGVFLNCESLQNVMFHDDLEVIGMEAFWGCHALTRVDLPDSLILLGRYSFAGTGLTSITIPDQVISIHPFCFDSCDKLTEVVMGSGIKEIGEYAFQACTSLKEIELPEKLEYIGDCAFRWCPLTSVVIPRFVNEFGSSVFSDGEVPMQIKFTGRAPVFAADSFLYLTADVSYPEGYASWTEDVRQNYEGTINWIPYQTDLPEPPDQHDHEFCDWYTVKEPTMTENGLEERVCSLCGLTETREMPRIPLPFTDVKSGAYYYDAVLWAVENKITAGTTATTFAPNDTCTRGQIVSFLWRAKGKPEPTSTVNPFTDVKEGDYFYKAVLWAVENGITSGTSATTFSPNAGCTRGQVAAFLWRAEGKQAPSSDSNPFTDVKPGAYYYNAVLWAVENKITAGTSATTFSPDATCTRGQIVSFLYRTYG